MSVSKPNIVKEVVNFQYSCFQFVFLEADSGRTPFFFFCNHFEELQTVLFQAELINNDIPLTYVYPNTIDTCLTPNHLLFGR